MQAHIEALKDSKHCPLWLDHEDLPATLPALQKDEHCELLIVGGGFTGLWAALQLKERNPDSDIILIEKTFIGDGASGRNGGFISEDLAHGAENMVQRFPVEAEKLAELGHQNVKEFLNTLERYGIDARYEKVGELKLLPMLSMLNIYVKFMKKIKQQATMLFGLIKRRCKRKFILQPI